MSDRLSRMKTDMDKEYVHGFAAADPTQREFRAPLISQIHGDLWMGGCKDGVRLPDDFQSVISLYPWERYHLGPNTVRVEYKLRDIGELPDVDGLQEIATLILTSLSARGKTLVHCQAGLNRSGLVTALAIKQKGGFTDLPIGTMDEAIDLLRTRRSPMVLCNPVFEAYLRSLP